MSDLAHQFHVLLKQLRANGNDVRIVYDVPKGTLTFQGCIKFEGDRNGRSDSAAQASGEQGTDGIQVEASSDGQAGASGRDGSVPGVAITVGMPDVRDDESRHPIVHRSRKR